LFFGVAGTLQFILLLVADKRLPTESLCVGIFVFATALPPTVIDSLNRHIVHLWVKVNCENLSALANPSILRKGCGNSVDLTPPAVQIPII